MTTSTECIYMNRSTHNIRKHSSWRDLILGIQSVPCIQGCWCFQFQSEHLPEWRIYRSPGPIIPRCWLWAGLCFACAAYLLIMPNVIEENFSTVQVTYGSVTSFDFWLPSGSKYGVHTWVVFFYFKGDSLLVLILMAHNGGLQYSVHWHLPPVSDPYTQTNLACAVRA